MARGEKLDDLIKGVRGYIIFNLDNIYLNPIFGIWLMYMIRLLGATT
jgi:hypothetical protein